MLLWAPKFYHSRRVGASGLRSFTVIGAVAPKRDRGGRRAQRGCQHGHTLGPKKLTRSHFGAHSVTNRLLAGSWPAPVDLALQFRHE